MSTERNTAQAFLDALQADPQLKRTVVRELFGEALLNLPAVVGQPEPGDQPLIQQVKGMSNRMEGLETRMTEVDRKTSRIDGQTGDWGGSEYENHVARLLKDHLYLDMGIRNASIMYRYQEPEMEDWLNSMNHAGADEDEGKLSVLEMRDLKGTDIIARVGPAGPTGSQLRQRESQPDTFLLAIESSMTGDDDDVRRACRRARLVERLSGLVCLPVVAAERLSSRLSRITGPLDPQEMPTGAGKIEPDVFNTLPSRSGDEGDNLNDDWQTAGPIDRRTIILIIPGRHKRA